MSLMVILFFVWLPAGAASADDADWFRSVTGPCDFVFPRDHGAHPGYRTEWWYYTGNLEAGDGRTYGFQLTFFRRQLRPDEARREWPTPSSAWRTHQIYLAHAALSDISGQRHLMAEKVSRETPGLAGAAATGGAIRVFLHDWEAVIGPESHTLRMADPAFSLDLTLAPTKGPVAHGERGYSRKGDRPEQASCYYSFPRLTARGRVLIGTEEVPVAGTAWMDHEYSTAPLAEGITGWDWFSLQLDDGADIMLFRLRRADGGLHPASSGTLIDPAGGTQHLARQDFKTVVKDRWTSPETGAVYPVAWEIEFPDEGLALRVTAAMNRQEMITTGSTGVVYWEGSVAVKGRRNGTPIGGRGYMELTGYADPEAPPL